MKLEGSLATFPLRELVEMVMYSSVTGVLEIYGSAGPGRLFFDDGRPYHSICGPRTGLEAVRELFIDPEANFLFIADITAESETLWMDPMEILDHCEDRARRLVQTRDVIPDLNWVPMVVQDASSQVSIDQEDWPLLSVIDGQHSVSEVADELSCDVVEVCESLRRMIERGQVTLGRPKPIVPVASVLRSAVLTPEAVPEVVSVAPKRGLLERLLDSLPDLEVPELPPAVPSANTPAPEQPSQPQEDPILKLLRG